MAAIRERNGAYTITVDLGLDVNKKHIRKNTTFHPDLSKLTTKTKKARENELRKMVEDFAAKFEEECKGGQTFDANRITLQQFSERWIDKVAKRNLQPFTLEDTKREIKNKIVPAIGHKKLSELNPAVINDFIISMTEDGCRVDGKKGCYSIGSIKKCFSVLNRILKTAEQWEIIERNPCDKVDLPAVKEQPETEKVKFFTPDQTASFLAFLENPTKVQKKGTVRHLANGKETTVSAYESGREIPLQNRVLLNLALMTGCRKGELLALQWDDIDFEAGTVRISKSISKADNHEFVKGTKTAKSNRTVSISGSMVKMLKELKAEQAAYILKVGDYFQNENWIFTRDNGQRIGCDTPYDMLQYMIDRYNKGKPEGEQLPHIPFHGLRHTSASALIANGVDVKTVADRLGHSKVDITLNIYTHSLNENDKAAAEKLDSIFEIRKQA